MPVTQVHEALGTFEIEFLGTVPREVLDAVQPFDHIAVIPGRLDPRQYGDGCLQAARYVGVIRRKKIADDGRTNLIEDDIQISGVGMEFWLGDDDNKGAIIETPQEFLNQSFSSVINALRPASVAAGTTFSVSGTYSGRHLYETPRSAIQYVCQTMSTSAVPVGYRVTNDCKLNTGPESSLYVTTPTCVIMRKGSTSGHDMYLKALQSTVDMDIDMEDFATRVVMLAEADGDQLATGSADISTVSPGTNVYKDLFGNSLSLTKLVSESDTLVQNADTRAELALREVIDPHRTLTIAASDFDIFGSFEVGDYIWMYDPDAGLIDTNNEITIRGLRINPVRLRATQVEFPVTNAYTVAIRHADGTWEDLTNYVHFEEEQTSNITIGDFNRDLTSQDSTVANRLGSTAPANSSIPDVVTWVTPFSTNNYLDGNGLAKAGITVSWNTPLNTDSSAITDGDHYELNIRRSGDTDWTVYNVAWGTNTFRFIDLAVATTYQFRIRAFDSGSNAGAFSTTQSQLSSSDNTAPSTPAAPTVAASTLAVQVTHTLGKASGGTYNLESDLAALEVHMGTTSGFTPTNSTLIGSMRANVGMMAATAAAVETFQVASTSTSYFKVIAVDTSGNKSAASTAVNTTALLVDDSHISDLTVTKITAGTLSANVLLGASIRTASSGQRVELNATGLHGFNSAGTELVTLSASTGQLTIKTATTGARVEMTGSGFAAYNSGGTQTVNISASDGSVSLLGQIVSGTAGKRLEIMPTSTYLPEIRFYANTGTNFAYINSFTTGTDSNLGLNSGTFTDTSTTVFARTLLGTGTSEIAVVRNDTQARFGGYVWVAAQSLTIGWNRANVDGGYFAADGTIGRVGWKPGDSSHGQYIDFVSDRTLHVGRWADFTSAGSNDGIWTADEAVVSAGDTAISLSYGATMATTMVPLATLRHPTLRTWQVTSASSTGFTVSFGTSSGSPSISVWSYRV